ncbi:hypothetical protein [Methylobacillus glycogenes]|uniref:hypothetical protein n=1 Tax=Methylobacillus glycogenes TaxID=406 RepID=UPI00046ECE82|nr:hypothetical protein [Methylobacillus glycogenes]
MNPLATLLSAAILLMVSLNASANPVTEDDNSHSQAHQLETPQTAIEHQSTTELLLKPPRPTPANACAMSPTPNRHVVQRYVGQ